MTTPLFILSQSGKDINEFNIGETTDGDLVVVSDHWHDLDPRIEDLLRSKGYETYFRDSMDYCHGCNKFCHLQPSCYGDLELPVIFDGELLCPDCVRDEPESYIEILDHNPDQANHLLDDSTLEDLGFRQLDNGYESGFHPGQDDDPNKIYNKIKDKFDHIIFSIDGAGQFDMTFSVWVKDDNVSNDQIESLNSLMSQN